MTFHIRSDLLWPRNSITSSSRRAWRNSRTFSLCHSSRFSKQTLYFPSFPLLLSFAVVSSLLPVLTGGVKFDLKEYTAFLSISTPFGYTSSGLFDIGNFDLFERLHTGYLCGVRLYDDITKYVDGLPLLLGRSNKPSLLLST